MSIEKIDVIRHACLPLIGRGIERFETAELLTVDGDWIDWPDWPLRLFCSGPTLLSISRSKFDDLWLAGDLTLPCDVGQTTRWKTNGIESLLPAIGRTIRGVSLGRGRMTWESHEVEIWTRLLFDLGECWLETFNALDENGYALHWERPEGEFLACA